MSERPTVMEPRIKKYRADLHIHSALSPCASDEMTPPAIVNAALGAGLDMIAVSDHNSAGNVAAVQEAARIAGETLAVLPGMEITSAEEVHVLALFPDVETAESVARHLRTLLPVAEGNYYSFFGDQPLLDAEGRTVGTETAALAAATTLDLDEVVELVHNAGGIAIAAHVDRKAFSVYSQLGLFPTDAGFDGIEVSRHFTSESPRLEEFAALGLPLTSSSDAHFLEDIGAAVAELRMTEPTFSELVLALAGSGDRSVARA
ncbi:MAG: PHP domain-containing protein [Actinobacteria bacterium]|nr:PHP domain-containing protein [Actinomycetota bacterium]